MTEPSAALLALLLAALGAATTCALVARRAARRGQQLAAAAERYAAVVESASDAVITVDDDQHIVVFNLAAERLLGCRREEVLGRSIDRFIPAPIRQAHAAWVAEFGRRGDASVDMSRGGRDVVAVHADGHPIPVEASISSLVEPGSDGRRRLYTVVLRDVSRRKAAEAELYRIGERYRAIVEQSPDAIWLAEGGTLRLVNAACVALFGARAVDELVGRPLSDFAGLESIGAGDSPGAPAQAWAAHEVRLRRLDGGEREVELSLATVPDHEGPALQGVMRDVSERKRAEAELRRTQASLVEAQRIARVGYFTYDVATRSWSGSPSLLELLGQPPGTTIHSWDRHIVHPEDRAAVSGHLGEEVLHGRGPFDLEFRILHGVTGEVRWLHALGHGRQDDRGRVTHLFGSVQDVTERKLATQALERQREELRRLSAGLTDAREQERRHVARELHDELGQRLSALKLDLSTLLPQVGADASAMRGRLRTLLSEVDEAIAATRRIATDLRPAMLDDLGLNAAIEWLAADWARRAGLKISLDCESIDGSLTESASTTIYRIVQEGLTNVNRHAAAHEVRVELHRRDPDLVLRIFDDGRGLAPGHDDNRGSSGLTGIRERARLLGGSASLRGRATRGCVLEVRLPLDRVDNRPGALQESL